MLAIILISSVKLCFAQDNILVGANQFQNYLPMLAKKRVAIVANATSKVDKVHLVDTLLSYKVKIKKVFAPEHGFRGDADAGEILKNGIDPKTKLPIISLYGKKHKPSKTDLRNIDIVIFDIQDVGARFYTYISTMHYVMEACADNNKKLIILDRPNPNGFYVDGPVLDLAQKSFVGMHPIPIVHGCTVGELAQMINNESWLKNKAKCKLTVITCKNYTHQSYYNLPVNPSPNLKTPAAIALYPSLCLFEGTPVSVGRGTNTPFELFGHPNFTNYAFQFKPISIIGASKSPPYQNRICYGKMLGDSAQALMRSKKQIQLQWLMETYNNYTKKDSFFINFFNLLAGNTSLQQQIKNGETETRIRASWEPALANYKTMRNKYLLYKD